MLPPHRKHGENVTFRLNLTPTVYDHLWKKAERAGISVPELVKRALERSAVQALRTGGSSADNAAHAPRRGTPDDQSG